MAEATVRPARSTDVPALAELARRTWSDEFGESVSEEDRAAYLTVWEKNERAIRLYESLGFRTVGTTTFTIGSGEVTEDLVMLLDKNDAAMRGSRRSADARNYASFEPGSQPS